MAGLQRRRRDPRLVIFHQLHEMMPDVYVKVAAVGRKKKRQPALKNRQHPNWPVTALAGVGMALTLYLALAVWFGEAPLYCAEGSSCDIVQQSRWGTFLGMPTAFWGFLSYTALVLIGVKVRNPERHWKSAWAVSSLGMGYSVYLTLVSLLTIDAVCAYCLVSLAIMTITFGVIVAQRPEGMKGFKLTVWAGQTAVVAVIFIGGMHLHYSGLFDPAAGPEDPYLKGLATHLAQENAVLYGAFWCPACEEQKDLFESSAKLLTYVECSPGGRGTPKAAECRINGINSYPTWVIGGRKYTGLLKPDRLAALSGYSAEKAD
jgi:uncharacterized membrane protein